MRGTAGAGVAALGIGATASTAAAEEEEDDDGMDMLDWGAVVGAYSVAGPLGASVVGMSYLGDEITDWTSGLLGDTRDYSGYTGGDALEQEIEVGVAEMRSADERVFTSILNTISGSENVGLSKGKAEIIRVMNNGDSEQTAQEAMQEEIDEYFAGIQRNILNHFISQYNQLTHHVEQLKEHEDTDTTDIRYLRHDNGSTSWQQVQPYEDFMIDGEASADPNGYYSTWWVEMELVDGTIYEDIPVMSHHELDRYAGMTPKPELIPDDANDRDSVVSNPSAWRFGGGEEDQVYFYYEDYWPLFDAVEDARDAVNATLSGFVSDVYEHWEPDEIPTEDLIDPITATTELAMDFDHYAGPGAFAAFAGIPTQAEQSLVLEVEPDGDATTIEADIYTNHVPTDADGNEVGFEADGETVYEPAEWDEPLYIGYTYTETNEDGEIVEESHNFAQLEDPFVVMEAFDADGEQVETFETRETNVQTSDVEALEEELDQLREEQIEMQNRAEEDMDDGGWGGLPDWGTTGGIFGGIAVVVILLGVLLQGAKSLHPATR